MLLVFLFAAVVLMASASVPSDWEWQRHDGNPVLRKSDAGWDSYEVYPGAVVTEGGEIKMWYLGHSSLYGVYALGYATSSDGVTWNKYLENPVMTKEANASNLGPISILARNDSFYMWYTSYMTLSSRIGYAYSADGVNWANYAGNPVLDITPFSWDKGGVSSPVVVYDQGIHKMWYAGESSFGRVKKIGYATSSDGISWQKQVGAPVIDTGSFGSWDDSGVFPTSIIVSDGTYEMWYTGIGHNAPTMLKIGRAISADGVKWDKDPANPVFNVGSPGAWDDTSVFRPMVLASGSQYMMWYGGSSDPPITAIGLATKGPPLETPTPAPSPSPTPATWYKLYLPVLMKMN